MPARLTSRHRLPSTAFDDLAAGYGDACTIARLRDAELSRRLLMIRAIVDRVERADGDPRSSTLLRPAYDMLAAVQRQSPGTVATVLLHPPVGAWAGWCLRQQWQAATGVTPYVAMGYLAAVAASTAIRARQPFQLTLPTWHGTVMLPTLGLAILGTNAPSGMAMIRADGSGVRIVAGGTAVDVPRDGAGGTTGWRALRRLRAEAAGLQISSFLDDMDPFRGFDGPTVATLLDAADVDCWQRQLEQAWTLLARHHRRYAQAIAAGLTSLVPSTAGRPDDSTSATSTDAFGAVLSTPAVDGTSLAATLLHEFQHAKLGALHHLFPLYRSPDGERHYAPWRPDPRPLGGLLHGSYAYLGVTDFWRVHRTVTDPRRAAIAHFEFARWRMATWQATRVLQASGRLTGLGARFVSGMRGSLRPWLAAPVPPAPLALARDAAADHWTSWRLHHLRPDPDGVARLATEYLAGLSLPRTESVPEVLRTTARPGQRNPRPRLMRQRLTDPEGFGRLAAVGTLAGDIALVQGDDSSASRCYRTRIVAEPDLPEPWAGLAVAQRRPGRTAHALRAHPEVVAAVYQQLRQVHGADADPVEVAAWLAPLRPVLTR